MQELSICDSDNVISCDIHTNCEACGLHPDDCYWESESNKCVVKEKTSSYNNDGKSEEWETISPGKYKGTNSQYVAATKITNLLCRHIFYTLHLGVFITLYIFQVYRKFTVFTLSLQIL